MPTLYISICSARSIQNHVSGPSMPIMFAQSRSSHSDDCKIIILDSYWGYNHGASACASSGVNNLDESIIQKILITCIHGNALSTMIEYPIPHINNLKQTVIDILSTITNM